MLAQALLAAMVLQGCSSGLQGLPEMPVDTAEYRAGAGDKIRVTVQDLTAADGEYEVDDSGSISLPLVKAIRVDGMTLREIENQVEAAYLQAGILNQPVVSVQPIELRPFYVMGEVNQPGEFKYRQGMTVLAALSAAGGYTYRAKTGEVAITRTVEGQEVTTRADENTRVLPGDRIRVLERWF
ncbi:MAG: polysaccharide export protein [Porphyrobacter sp.]|nr:polysaccharide export protein [Porphyrobacter sp.]